MTDRYGMRVYMIFGVLALGLFGVAVATVGVDRAALSYAQTEFCAALAPSSDCEMSPRRVLCYAMDAVRKRQAGCAK